MTEDFFEDAIDSLMQMDQSFLVISSFKDGHPKSRQCGRVYSLEQIEWIQRRFNEWYDTARSDLLYKEFCDIHGIYQPEDEEDDGGDDEGPLVDNVYNNNN